MIKPAKFSDLPYRLQEELLWDMELDYDSYESSKESAIHEWSNGQVSANNKYIIENSYKNMTEDFLLGRAKSLLENEEFIIKQLREFVK
jgi:hypothetical protein